MYALTNDVDGVRRLCARDTNQKVVGLNVTVDEGLLVDGLDASDLKERFGMSYMKHTKECYGAWSRLAALSGTAERPTSGSAHAACTCRRRRPITLG